VDPRRKPPPLEEGILAMGEEFQNRKFASMDRAVDDNRLTDLDCRLLWKLTSAADRTTGTVRRKQRDLADALNVSSRAVQLSIDRLSAYGYIAPRTSNATGSRSYVNAYEIAPKTNRYSHLESEPGFVSRKKKANLRSREANLGSEKNEPPFVHDPLSSLGIPKRIKKLQKGKISVKCESPAGHRWRRYCSENGIREPVRSLRTDSYLMLPSEEPPAAVGRAA
jgi:DNA-binding MarR family transcriptional regulator